MKKKSTRTQQSYGDPKKFVTVKLPIKIIEALDTVAAYDNVTRSYLTSNILDNYVKQYDIQNRLKEIEKPYRY